MHLYLTIELKTAIPEPYRRAIGIESMVAMTALRFVHGTDAQETFAQERLPRGFEWSGSSGAVKSGRQGLGIALEELLKTHKTTRYPSERRCSWQCRWGGRFAGAGDRR